MSAMGNQTATARWLDEQGFLGLRVSLEGLESARDEDEQHADEVAYAEFLHDELGITARAAGVMVGGPGMFWDGRLDGMVDTDVLEELFDAWEKWCNRQ